MKRKEKKCTTGYQLTKVGVIPNDWGVVYLKEVATIKRGKFSPRPRNDPRFFGGKIPFVQTNIIVKSNGVIKNYSQTLNNDGLKVSRLFPKGTILMTIAANIGFTGILQEAMACTDSIVGIECSSKVYNVFLNYYLTSIQVRIDHIAEKAAQKNINLKTLNILKTPLPPIEEQNKIAKILGTWDKAISMQQQLIQHKLKLKKGLMQKLLSADIRFKEFNEDWKEVKLGDAAIVKMGQSPSSKSYNKQKIGLPLVQGNADCENRKTKPRFYTSEPTKTCSIGDIIISVRAPVGNVSKSLHKACIGRGVCSIKSHENNEYLYQFFLNYNKKWIKYSQGSTFTAINSKDIKNIIIKLTSIKEQKKIAQVLSLADKEIELLQEHLQQLLQQKQGLMQKLLTGEIRVKPQGEHTTKRENK